MAQRLDDPLLRVPMRDIEPFGDFTRGELLVIVETQHLALGGVEPSQDSPHDQLALDPIRLGGHYGLGDGVEACAFDCVHTRPCPPVRTAGIADRANEERAGVGDVQAGTQQRQHRVVYEALAVVDRDVELPSGDREQERAVCDVELAYVGSGR
jgi:hypothetical protein